jgi:hypothetical protein
VAVVYGTVPGQDGSLTLWIDTFQADVSAAREREIMGYVCRQHGERLAPPRGWMVDDRRESAPRLFRPQPNLSVVRDTAPRSRKDKVRDLPRPSLFAENSSPAASPVVESPAPVPETPMITETVIDEVLIEEPVIEEPVIEEPVVVEAVVEEPVVEAPVIDVPAPEPVADPTPLRAANVVVGPEPSVDPSGDVTRAWEPYFDPDDDLDGQLNATGSMLRDAFRSRHNGRRNG